MISSTGNAELHSNDYYLVKVKLLFGWYIVIASIVGSKYLVHSELFRSVAMYVCEFIALYSLTLNYFT